MSNPFIPDNNNRQLEGNARRYAQQRMARFGHMINPSLIKETMTGFIPKSAALLKLMIQLMQRINPFDRNRNQDRNNRRQGLGNRALDRLMKNNPGKGRGKILNSLGNKGRNLIRGAKTVNKARKATKAASMAKKARTAHQALRIAHTAKKLKTVATIGKAARVAMVAPGGLALAGGPVGIAVFGASLAAPYVIGSIWKNRHRIYNSSAREVAKSDLGLEDSVNIVRAKNAKVGEIVPEAKQLKIADTEGKVLFESDKQGKVLTNGFAREHKLNFYQEDEASGEKSILLAEPEIMPQVQQTQSDLLTFNYVTQPEAALKDETHSVANDGELDGVNVALNALNSLQQNNPNDKQMLKDTQLLKQGLNSAQKEEAIEAKPQQVKLNLNSAGTSLIAHFHQNSPVLESLKTQDYQMSRRGYDYSLKDKEGNLLLQIRQTALGTSVIKDNLSNSDRTSLKYLQEDQKLGAGITGGFKIIVNKAMPEVAMVGKVAESKDTGNNQAVEAQTKIGSSKLIDRIKQHEGNQGQEPIPAMASKSKSKDIEL